MTQPDPAPEHELLLALGGIAGPVSTAELVAAARANGASDRVVATLASLPDKEWKTVEDAAAEVGTGWAR